MREGERGEACRYYCCCRDRSSDALVSDQLTAGVNFITKCFSNQNAHQIHLVLDFGNAVLVDCKVKGLLNKNLPYKRVELTSSHLC